MSTNPWFKHWGEASRGHTLSTLWANGDVEGIALFWLILELVCRYKKRDSDVGEITISWDVLSRETNWKPSKCRRVLARISPVSQIELSEKQTGYATFLVHNWLKYQDSRGGKRVSKKEQNHVRREKREERRENTDSAPIGVEFDFEVLYQNYPRRIGKAKAFKVLQSTIKTNEDYSQLDQAIKNYASEVARLKTEEKYIKHFSSFIGSIENQSWREYISTQTTNKKSGTTYFVAKLGKKVTEEEFFAMKARGEI